MVQEVNKRYNKEKTTYFYTAGKPKIQQRENHLYRRQTKDTAKRKPFIQRVNHRKNKEKTTYTAGKP
jgi:hypothetical protein